MEGHAGKEARAATSRWVLDRRRCALLVAAGALRFMSGQTTAAYMPAFYDRTFPKHHAEVALAYGVSTAVFGTLSSWTGRWADELGRGRERRALLLPAVGTLLSVPLAYGTLFAPELGGGFYTSVALRAVKVFVSEVWMGPTLSVLQGTVAPGVRGLATAATLALWQLVGGMAPFLIGRWDGGGASDLAALVWRVASTVHLAAGVLFALASW